jgi:hypothetical protein
MDSPWQHSNLSLSQWLLWHEQRRGAPYVLSPLAMAFSFFTKLDTKHFRQAFQSVVDRSDALRTVFVEEGGVPRRAVLPHLPLAMEIVDLSQAYQPLLAYEQWCSERELRPLAPASKAFDSTLVRLDDQHYVWRLTLHRLIGDSRSLLLIYQETAAAYALASPEMMDALPPLPCVENFIEYERQQLAEQLGSMRFLDGLAAPHPRPHVPRPLPLPGERYTAELGAERTARLRQSAQDLLPPGQYASCRIFLLCAGALVALMAQSRNCPTVCIDTDLDTRAPGPWESAIGRISRMASLTVTPAPGEESGGLLREVIEAFAAGHAPGQVPALGVRPAASCRVLLQVDDMTYAPFAHLPVKVERMDNCCSPRKGRQARDKETAPALCLWIDSYGSRENLRATFVCCGQQLHGQGPQLAEEYIRLLDALLAARAQPVQSTRE